MFIQHQHIERLAIVGRGHRLPRWIPERQLDVRDARDDQLGDVGAHFVGVMDEEEAHRSVGVLKAGS